MSRRELRALLADQRGSSAYCNLPQRGTRSSRNRAQLQPTGRMSDQEEEVSMADRLLEMAESKNRRKDEELRRSSQMLQEAEVEVQTCRSQVDRYAAEIERVKVQCELEKHRALDLLRGEHAGQLKFLQTQTERKRERIDNWIAELKEWVERENQGYRDRIDVLEGELYKRQARPNPHDPYLTAVLR